MTKIIQRHDTSTNWTSINPVLALGEMGIETDTNKFKFGDGVTSWTSLSYASAEGGGGGADLSNYYTKEETYNQEEIDNLLDKKQDVLTPIVPIEIGSTTIGGPYNMTINASTNKVLPVYPNNLHFGNFADNNSIWLIRTDVTSASNSIDELFSGNTSYFDIPCDFGSLIKKVEDGEIGYARLTASIGGLTNFSRGYMFLAGQQTSDGFIPIAYGRATASTTNATSYVGATALLTGEVVPYGQGCKMPWITARTVNASSSFASDNPTVEFNIAFSNNTFEISSHTYGSSTQYYTTVSNIAYSNKELFSKINVIRVFSETTDVSDNYLPTTDKIQLLLNYVDTGWRITDGAVTTYGVSLKYDNQTIQVNANGELVANLDELGNEVNSLAGSLNGKADTDGSNMVASVKKFDGQWLKPSEEVFLLETGTADTYNIDLSSILPNDGYAYEVLLNAYVNASTNTQTTIEVSSSLVASTMLAGASRNDVSRYQSNIFTLPIGSDKVLTATINITTTGSAWITLNAYRRVGTNE